MLASEESERRDRRSDAFGIVVRTDPDRPVVVVTGEIDIATAPDLHSVVRQLIAQGHRQLTVDLGSVSFMDCRALTFLLSASRQLAAADGSLRVVGGSRLLRRLLDTTGLAGTFPDWLSAET